MPADGPRIGSLGCTRDGYWLIGTAYLGGAVALMFSATAYYVFGVHLERFEQAAWVAVLATWCLGILVLARYPDGPLPRWCQWLAVSLAVSPSLLRMLYVHAWEISLVQDLARFLARQDLPEASFEAFILAWGSACFCWKDRAGLLSAAWGLIAAYPLLGLTRHLYARFDVWWLEAWGLPVFWLALLILPWWTAAWLSRRIHLASPHVAEVGV